MPLSKGNLQILKQNFQWPSSKPSFQEVNWVLDGGGRHLVSKKIDRELPFLIIEIGSFLGSSIKTWLKNSPNTYVIAIDPWQDGWPEEYAKKHGRDDVAKQFSKKNGLYNTFISSLWEYKEQIFPVRGRSPEKLYDIAELGIVPDLIYFDAEKDGNDIEVAHKLFPDAIIAGDDWTWGIAKGYPIRKAVESFTKKNDYMVVSDRATWILKKNNLSVRDRLYNILNKFRDYVRIIKNYLPKIERT